MSEDSNNSSEVNVTGDPDSITTTEVEEVSRTTRGLSLLVTPAQGESAALKQNDQEFKFVEKRVSPTVMEVDTDEKTETVTTTDEATATTTTTDEATATTTTGSPKVEIDMNGQTATVTTTEKTTEKKSTGSPTKSPKKRKNSSDQTGDITAKFAKVAGRKGKGGQWIIANHKGELVKEGFGIGALKEAFEDSKVQFAVIRIDGVDEQEKVTSVRSKMVRLDWVGSSVKIRKRKRSLTGKPIIQKMWEGVSVTMSVKSIDELDAVNLCQGLLNACGAHKPTYYEFGDKQVPLADVQK